MLDLNKYLKVHSPSYVIEIYKDGKNEEITVGNRQTRLTIKECNSDTLYDIASLTKVFTATLVYIAYEENKLNINDFVYNIDNRFTNLKDVKIIDLLSHNQEIWTDGYLGDAKTQEEFYKIFPNYEQRKKVALSISKWNIPPVHVYRQVEAMMYTPSGQSAFDNPIHKPIKKDGTYVKGYKNTYMRQRWGTPAYTITMDNRKISSQGNVHPGRFISHGINGEDIYSDPRTLTLYELMLVMSLPKDWALPNNAEEAFVRRIIGEGIVLS